MAEGVLAGYKVVGRARGIWTAKGSVRDHFSGVGVVAGPPCPWLGWWLGVLFGRFHRENERLWPSRLLLRLRLGLEVPAVSSRGAKAFSSAK